ncbi:MAG: M3 family metallopeptidase, partial [Myxococcales bacterium]|nr:M3 family metallopeptidase [Myxococcales bacterium]
MSAPDSNPLLGDLDRALPFDAVRAEHVEPAIDALIAEAQANLDAVAAAPAGADFAATFGALDEATGRLETAMGLVDHLEGVLGDPALRAAYNAVQPRVSAFYSTLGRDERLYAVCERFAQVHDLAALAPDERRFVETTLDGFRRAGVALDAEAKAKVQAIDVALSELTTRFAQNVVDASDAWHLDLTDEARLAGLPESAKAAARAEAREAGVEGWRLTLRPPCYVAVLTYAEDRALREALYRAYNRRATEGEQDNGPLMGQILDLRRRKANLLGYADISDLLLAPRMVKSGANARAFVDDLRARSEAAFAAETQALQAFRAERVGADEGPMAPWDVSFWAERLRQHEFAFDEEALRPYFEVNGVLEGMYALVQRLYGVRITPLSDRPGWHPDVKIHALDDADGTRLGLFYADLFPRAGKRAGAWMRPMVTGDPAKGVPHVAVMCANITAPVDGKPALLTHREVETLFHEFGHLLHHLLTTARLRGQAGTNVAWDFVELPSQIMENWTWHGEALDLFARHHETGEPIPADLLEKMRAARTFRGATAQMRQLGFGTVDLALHRDYDPARDGDVVAYARAQSVPFSPAPLPDDYSMITGFTHLFASPVGYAAAYYSYKWAEV